MSDKEKKKASLLSSLRRSLVRPAGAEETRPMLPSAGSQARPKATPRKSTGRAAENFEISLRDKSDATAKRGFRVSLPKRMLSWAVIVFVVAPLTLFVYMEVHRVATSHGHVTNGKVPEHHFHHDVLSLLTDEDEKEPDAVDALVESDSAIENVVAGGNATDIGDVAIKNSTLVEEANAALASNATNVLNKTDSGAEEAKVESNKQQEDADPETKDRRVLRKSIR